MRSLGEQLKRLQRIAPFLRCPQCGGKLIRHGDEVYKSASCGAEYPIDHGVPILLPPSLAAQGLGQPLPPDQHASTHPYSTSSEKLIAQFQEGLVLDLGAGGKHIEHPNVIQMDVFRFPMVDVVASADALPFRADVFDAVISQAVFEHLQYPEAAASEIWRVLKPDGIAKIDTAFLQPEHAYPHHYFNATEAGLRHWFRDFELQWSGVEEYQHPKWALLWFLDVYLAALPPHAQEKVFPIDLENCIAILKRLQTGQLDTAIDLEIGRALDELAPESVRKLAAGVSVNAVKRVATMSAVPRQNGQTTAAQLELERRLQAQTAIIQQDQEYKKTIAQINLIKSDRTRFLLHEYELDRQDPLVNPGLLRPMTDLLTREWHLFLREVRQRLPESWWQTLRQGYRWLTGKKPPHTIPHIPISVVTQKAAISFWGHPQNPVALLDQFFSLVHQTNGDWVYLLETSPHHSAAMHRLMWELQQRDARVCVLSEEAIKVHLSSTAGVQLPSDAVLAFDAVEELVTLLQQHPKVQYITADAEKWGHMAQYTMRCWGLIPTKTTTDHAYIRVDRSALVLINPKTTITTNSEDDHFDDYAHIPKVLYRLVPFASV